MSWQSDCGRAQVLPLSSGWQVLVDQIPLKRGRSKSPLRFSSRKQAISAAQEFLQTGAFTPPPLKTQVYKTYDPETEGYGNPEQWKSLFSSMFSPLPQEDAYSVLGLNQDASWSDIKTAFRQMALTHHPDHGGTELGFCRIREAYEILKNVKS